MGSFLKKLTILSPYSSPKPNEFFPNIASIYESINTITKIKNQILNILSVLSLKNKKFSLISCLTSYLLFKLNK